MKNLHQKNHPYHLVTISPWPLLMSLSLMNMMIGMVQWMHSSKMMLMIMGVTSTILILFQWWRDVIRESTFQGMHTKLVYKSLKIGMMLFIISEAFFFLAFFWAYFHNMLSPGIEIGMIWPPKGIKTFNPYSIPLLNTVILISSGFTVTWCHFNIISNNLKKSLDSLKTTIFLGIYFTLIQMFEYYHAPFTIADSVFGSIFFMSTGFHGIHVIIGTLFLSVCFFRMKMMHFSSYHHFGFEAATWYWHFVDVVWLFLYMFIYWWIY